MRLKDITQIGAWSFAMIDPEGNEVSVPAYGTTGSLNELVGQVMQYISIYDEATEGKYSEKQRELAEEKGLTIEAYINKLIQHQMCLRGGVECWSDGTGDTIHSLLTKVDSYVKKAPRKIRDEVQAAISKLTPSRSKTFGGCSACGGTTVFNPNKDNLGRAGKLNRKKK